MFASPMVKRFVPVTFLGFVLLLCSFFPVFSQQIRKIEILNADVSEFDQSLNAKATRLIGNVAFRHENAVMYCDSAYLYRDENRLEAFHNIRITQGDTFTLTGKRLLYDGNTRQAQVFEDVELSDRRMTLRTSQLNYDMDAEIASYRDSANIVDGENTLTSKLGYYYSSSHDMYFRENVLLVNPRYRMTGDTLRYNTIDKVAWFLGPTRLYSKTNVIYCENGWYNTLNQTSSFHKNSYLQTGTQTLQGDSVLYDRNTGVGRVFGNVSIRDSANKIIIAGDYGEHHELTDSSWVTGHAVMSQIFDKDTLFLHGDTLLATGQKTEGDTLQKKKNMFAFHHVKLYKPDFQGSCDSLVYNYRDSTIRLYSNPILWSGLNQLTADSVTLQTANSEISRILLVNNAFITSKADSTLHAILDSTRFNQIRGKRMTGFFEKNELYRIDVEGNGQTIYYAKNKHEQNFAVNRADCSDMIIFVNQSKVKSITLQNDPDGTMYPIHELSTSELRLKGFSWQEKKRPASKADLFDGE
ncbi:MAG TPA: OstA-like protein [Bacteroidia bacterium]|nr:OstA-like protein [Bacteroidia bacterium]